jgi:hypothetical protein
MSRCQRHLRNSSCIHASIQNIHKCQEFGCCVISGPTGATGPSGLSGLLSITYAYGAPIIDSPNVFSDFGLLCIYLSSLHLDTLITIYIDGTYCGNQSIIGPGIFFFPLRVLFQGLTSQVTSIDSGLPTVTVQTGTEFMGLSEISFKNIFWVFEPNISQVIMVNNQILNIWLYDASLTNGGSMNSMVKSSVQMSSPSIIYANGSFGSIFMYGQSSILGPNIVFYFDATSACNTIIYAYDFAKIEQNAINYSNASCFRILVSDTVMIDPSYTSVIGLQGLQANASLIKYDPLFPEEWAENFVVRDSGSVEECMNGEHILEVMNYNDEFTEDI